MVTYAATTDIANAVETMGGFIARRTANAS
jgi:hypothetical protein